MEIADKTPNMGISTLCQIFYLIALVVHHYMQCARNKLQLLVVVIVLNFIA